MSIKDRIIFTMVPLNTDDKQAMSILLQYAMYHAAGEYVPLMVQIPQNANSVSRLAEVETIHQVLSAYCWFSFKFPETFTERDRAKELQAICREIIEKSIASGLKPVVEPRESKKKRSKNYMKNKIKMKKFKIEAELEEYGFVPNFFVRK
jgi:hypothetical protein